jgi:TolA-binding protein
MENNGVFTADEVKAIIERYFTNFGAQTGQYVFNEIMLNRRIQHLQDQLDKAIAEIEALKASLNQAQHDILAAQGKAIIDRSD